MNSLLDISIIGSISLFVWVVLWFLEKKSGLNLDSNTSLKKPNQMRAEINLLKIYKYTPQQIADAIAAIEKRFTEKTVDEILNQLRNTYGDLTPSHSGTQHNNAKL